MEPQDALEATKNDLVIAAELAGEDPESVRNSVEMIITRYEEYKGEEEATALTDNA